MLRAVLTGSAAAGDSAVAHGLAVAPDFVSVSKRGDPDGTLVSVDLSTTPTLAGFNTTNVLLHAITANCRYSVLCMAWQGRSY